MDFQKRKNIRLKGYNYSESGYYFITIAVVNRKNYFWKSVGECSALPNKQPQLSRIGFIVDESINNIPRVYPNIIIDKYIIMPNHIHMIIVLDKMNFESKDSKKSMTSTNIPNVISQMKGYATKKIGFSLWQKSYYDHIIRNRSEYQEIWNYIDTNPLKWELDTYYIK